MRGRVALAAGTGLLLLTACSSGVRTVSDAPSGSIPASLAPSSSAVSSSSATPTDAGVVVRFTDDFHSSSSGWEAGKLPSGTTFAYGKNSYVVVARGGLNHTQFAPPRAITRPGATATFVLPRSAPAGTAVGVFCRGGSDTAGTEIQFLVDPRAGTWRIELFSGPLVSTDHTTVFARGRTSTTAGTTPVAVTGRCLTQSGGKVTRAVLLVDGQVAADRRVATVPSDAAEWRTGFVVADVGRGATTVLVTSYELRFYPA